MTRTNPMSMQHVYLIPEAFLSGSKQVRTPAEAGYEPNAVLKAMAQRRGGSLPPSRSDAALVRCKLWQQRKAIRRWEILWSKDGFGNPLPICRWRGMPSMVHAGDRWMLSTRVALPKDLGGDPRTRTSSPGDASDYEQSDQEELAQRLGQRWSCIARSAGRRRMVSSNPPHLRVCQAFQPWSQNFGGSVMWCPCQPWCSSANLRKGRWSNIRTEVDEGTLGTRAPSASRTPRASCCIGPLPCSREWAWRRSARQTTEIPRASTRPHWFQQWQRRRHWAHVGTAEFESGSGVLVWRLNILKLDLRPKRAAQRLEEIGEDEEDWEVHPVCASHVFFSPGQNAMKGWNRPIFWLKTPTWKGAAAVPCGDMMAVLHMSFSCPGQNAMKGWWNRPIFWLKTPAWKGAAAVPCGDMMAVLLFSCFGSCTSGWNFLSPPEFW